MKTIQPSSEKHIDVPANADRTDISDLYLKTGEMVQATSENIASAQAEDAANRPLSVQPEFRVSDAAGIAGGLLALICTPLVAQPLLSLGAGNSGNVIAGVSFTFLMGYVVIFAIRALYGAIQKFCVAADISFGLTLAVLVVPVLLAVWLYIRLYSVGNTNGSLIVIALAGFAFYGCLAGVYAFVHRKRLFKKKG